MRFEIITRLHFTFKWLTNCLFVLVIGASRVTLDNICREVYDKCRFTLLIVCHVFWILCNCLSSKHCVILSGEAGLNVVMH